MAADATATATARGASPLGGGTPNVATSAARPGGRLLLPPIGGRHAASPSTAAAARAPPDATGTTAATAAGGTAADDHDDHGDAAAAASVGAASADSLTECVKCLEPGSLRACCDAYVCDACFFRGSACPRCGKKGGATAGGEGPAAGEEPVGWAVRDKPDQGAAALGEEVSLCQRVFGAAVATLLLLAIAVAAPGEWPQRVARC